MNDVELWQGIRSVMVADATFAGYLAAPDAVYESEPGVPLKDGSATIRVLDDMPDVGLSGLGKWEPRLQINLYASSRVKLADMKTRLDVILDIPRSRSSPILTTQYHLGVLYRTGENDLGTVATLAGDVRIRHLALSWKAVVRLR